MKAQQENEMETEWLKYSWMAIKIPDRIQL